MTTQNLSREDIHQAVQNVYGAVARTRNKESKGGGAGNDCCAPSCCSTETKPLSDYTSAELASVPKGAYLGEGSGAPVRHLGLKVGEVVVDLGSGAGMDTFLAANAVGPLGRVHGFDLTPDMLERARTNAAVGGYKNVSFERTDIEKLPLADGAADAAISNCVINLTPDKAAVYREIFRVLKPGGRISIADIVLRGTEQAVRQFRESANVGTWCACVSGALVEQDYLAAIRSVGFADVRVAAERVAQTQPGGELSGVAVTITARKPA